MPKIADFEDPRYLSEVGWFLYREKNRYEGLTSSYSADRMDWSVLLWDEVVTACGQDHDWVKDKTVVTIGCGCMGDIAAWPAACKIAIDPLLYTYQHLNMLVQDAPGTNQTIYLSVGVEDIPLVDECADIVLCRNALDHMPDPKEGLNQISRILRTTGVFYLSVDVGGGPTPDEPSPFTHDSLLASLEDQFEILSKKEGCKPHSRWRDYGVQVVARKKRGASQLLSKESILQAYEASTPESGDADDE